MRKLPFVGFQFHVSPALTESVNATTKKKPERMVIDLSGAAYIDSSGLAAIILVMRKVEA